MDCAPGVPGLSHGGLIGSTAAIFHWIKPAAKLAHWSLFRFLLLVRFCGGWKTLRYVIATISPPSGLMCRLGTGTPHNNMYKHIFQ